MAALSRPPSWTSPNRKVLCRIAPSYRDTGPWKRAEAQWELEIAQHRRSFAALDFRGERPAVDTSRLHYSPERRLEVSEEECPALSPHRAYSRWALRHQWLPC